MNKLEETKKKRFDFLNKKTRDTSRIRDMGLRVETENREVSLVFPSFPLDGDAGLLGAFKLLELGSTEAIENLRLKQTDRHTVFIRLTVWVNSNNGVPHAPQTASEWAGFAEAHFWIRHLKLETAMTDTVEMLDLSWPLEQLSFRGFGEVLLSLSYAPETVYQKVIKPLQRRIMECFCAETKTIAIEETDEMVRAHYLVPMESPENSTDKKVKTQTGHRSENETIKLLHLLRMFIPNRKAYAVQGYGQNCALFPCRMI